MPFYGESLEVGLDALKEIEVWIHNFKKYHNRLPQSFYDLTENTPSDQRSRVGNLFSFYKERRGYIFNFSLIDTNKISISLEDGNLLYKLENEDNNNFFYINEILVIEYSRDTSGNILNYKEYFQELLHVIGMQ